MAVVIRKKDYESFLAHAKEENLEATYVADVTADARLTMRWRGKTICDISREFLNTNGATKNADVEVELPEETQNYFAKPTVSDVKQKWLSTLGNLNSCSQKGLSERFDSTIGANTVLMPFGGAYQMTPNEAMVAKLPVLTGETDTASAMAYGFDPDLSSFSPFHGAQYSVLESVATVSYTHLARGLRGGVYLHHHAESAPEGTLRESVPLLRQAVGGGFGKNQALYHKPGRIARGKPC